MARLITSSPRARRLLRVALGAAVIIATVVAVGTGPFLRGLAAVSPGAILAALALTAASTSAAAWRWRTVAGALGLRLRWSSAVASYYRSQFLNAVLPGGVLGDVHRAYHHGRRTGDVPLAARAVATERISGQLVQLLLVAVVLAGLGVTSPMRRTEWIVGIVAAAGVLAVALVAVTRRGRRVLGRELAIARRVFARPRSLLAVTASSILVVASLATMFVVACLAVGVHAPPRDLIALALVTLAAASLPINIAGWGPREAASASAFAIAGLGADVGVAVSTAFGVLALISVAPGAVVLIADRIATGKGVERVHQEASV